MKNPSFSAAGTWETLGIVKGVGVKATREDTKVPYHSKGRCGDLCICFIKLIKKINFFIELHMTRNKGMFGRRVEAPGGGLGNEYPMKT